MEEELLIPTLQKDTTKNKDKKILPIAASIKKPQLVESFI